MISKMPTAFKTFIILTAALTGLVPAGNRPACAGASNAAVPHAEKQHPQTMIVGQSPTRPSAPQTNTPASESSQAESQTRQTQNSEAAKEKPLKDFQPSEKIDADQAVDFPYDI
jgi:hypothetical protein